MIRLGFSVRIVGRAALRSHDSRRVAPHLSVSLVHLRDVLGYLDQIGVHFYRVASGLLPTVEDGPEQIRECSAELDLAAAQIAAQGLRLTLHLEQHVALGHDDPAKAAHSLHVIETQAGLLECLDAYQPVSAQSALVVHVGGSPNDQTTLDRFARRYATLSPRARSRLVVEHDTTGFSLGRLLELHQRCGIPLVFDHLHWCLSNPEGIPLDIALGLALATWPQAACAEVHLSSMRSEAHLVPAQGGKPARVLPPRPGQHADFIAVTDLQHVLQATHGLPLFDLMLEAKAGDLALLRLRDEIGRVAPELARRVT